MTIGPPAALADLWYEHYTAAEKALAAEEWAEAIDQVNQALEKKGDSGARARTYGMKFISYFPYLKLGISYYRLGQLDAALQALETEERLGAIADAPGELALLTQTRGLIQSAQKSQREAEAERIATIVRTSLAEASDLQREGRIEEAIAALGKALAVEPENREALDNLTDLRGELSRRRAEEELEERLVQLIESAREDLAGGFYSEASSSLRQALALADNTEARDLLDEAQQRLRAELEMEVEDRSLSIERSIREAAELRAGGRFDEALDRLQTALAIDRNNREALDLQRSLLADQASERAGEQDRLRIEALERLIAEGAQALAESRFEDALTQANRVLALESGNAAALDQLARAYRGINRSLLGATPRQNFPPAIRFVDRRQERADGPSVESVASPDFLLSGIVIDNSSVDVAFYQADGSELDGESTSQPVGDLYVTEFRLTHRLRPGMSTLLLVATDSENVVSSSEYSVVYTRPWFRSPGLAAALVLLLAAAIGVAWGQRARRRAQRRRRRFNPYVAGAPVLNEDLFFGRQRLLDRILQTLHNNSLLLHGERRIGKTTLQHQLKRRLEALEDPDYEFFPVFVDLQGTPEELFFATLAEEVFQELAPHLEGLEPSSARQETYVYRDLVRDLRRVLKVLNRRSQKRIRLVLLIDEVDELNSYDPRVNQKLRSLFMKSFAEDLVAVVSGVSIKKEWEREGSPWYNFFEEINVGPFDEENARALIEDPIRGLFRLEEGTVERIIELTDGRPYLIQAICMKLVNRMYEVDRRSIAPADVDAVASPTPREAA